MPGRSYVADVAFERVARVPVRADWRTGRVPRWAVAVAAVAVTVLWMWGLRAPMTYDEGVYAETARLLRLGHPLVSDVFTSQPPLWPYLSVPGAAVDGVTGIRVSVMVWGLVGLVALFRVARLYCPPRVAAFVTLVVAVTPAYATMAPAAEAELPAMACALWAVALVFPARRPQWAGPVAGVLMGCAVMTKLLLLPVTLVVLAALLEGERPSRARWRPALGFLATLVVSVAMIALPFWDRGGLYEQVVGFHVAAQGVLRGLVTNLSTAGRGPFTCALLVLGAVAALHAMTRRDRLGRLLALWLVLTGGFLVLHVPLFTHHLVLAVPPAVIAIGAELGRRWRPASVLVALSGLALLSTATLAWDFHSAGTPHPAARDAALAALERLPSGAVVLTDDQTLTEAAGLVVPGPMVDTSLVRFASHDLTADQVCREVPRATAALLTVRGRFQAYPAIAACVGQGMHLVWRGSAGSLYER